MGIKQLLEMKGGGSLCVFHKQAMMEKDVCCKNSFLSVRKSTDFKNTCYYLAAHSG